MNLEHIGILVKLSNVKSFESKHDIINYLGLSRSKSGYEKINHLIKSGIIQPNGKNLKINVNKIAEEIRKDKDVTDGIVDIVYNKKFKGVVVIK